MQVAHSLERLGPAGLSAHYGIRPDLITLGKYIGGGFSFGAVGGKRSLLERLDLSRPGAWVHAGTFNNNLFTMNAVTAMLETVYTGDVARDLTAAGDLLRQQLNAECDRSGLAVQATGMGSMMNVHFAAGPLRSSADIAHVSPSLRDLFYLHMLEHGLWIARRGMINASVTTGVAECSRLIEAFRLFLDRYRDLLPRA